MAKAAAKTTVSTGGVHIFAPIGGKPSTIGGVFGENRGDHIHAGLDIDCPLGSPCIAPVDGRIVNFATDHDFAPSEGAQGGGGMIQFQFLQDLGPIKKGDVIGWGHVFHVYANVGDSVKGGQKIASSGETTFNGAEHVHLIYQSPESPGTEDGTDDPAPIYTYLRTNGKDTSGFTGSGNSGGGAPTPGTVSSADVQAISKGAALAAFINLPGLLTDFASLALKGERSLMNDQPLLPFIEQLCQASLRNFQSMPNGNFFAFVPDYFGGLGVRTPYWDIEDIEITSATIDLSDDALATHIYVVGDTGTIDGQIDLFEKTQTAGVVTVFNAFLADFTTGVDSPQVEGTATKGQKAAYTKKLSEMPSLAEKSNAISFLQKYGARPYFEEAPMIRSHYFEMFLAYQVFCLMWSKQFLTTFEFTFMPELFPGGIVRFPEHGIQCYIDEVSHEGSYTDGFVTRANLSAPAALPGGQRGVHEGMIRAGIFSPTTVLNPAQNNSSGNDGQNPRKANRH